MIKRLVKTMTLVTGPAAVAAVGLALSIAPAETVVDNDWWGEPTVEVHNARVEAPKNVPTWTKADAKAFPGCTEGDPATAGLVDYVVVKNDASRVFMTFGEVWERGQDDNSANDVWIVGICS